MKVCVFGAGAVGGHVAARLMANGTPVSVVARGAQLSAIREHGLSLRHGGLNFTGRPLAATDDASTLPAQDFVFVTLKTPSLPRAANAVTRLLKPDGAAVFVLNGIPWWWRHGLAESGGPLPLLDPDGMLWKLLRTRTLGCLTYSGSEVVTPGVIECRTEGHWALGEPDGSESERLGQALSLLTRAGFDVRASTDLRRDIWMKLLLNASRNTLAALTRLPSLYLSLDDGLRHLLVAVMQETLAIARATGWPLEDHVDLSQLAEPGGRSPRQRPSMLQDVLAGRPTEHEAVLGQPIAFARELNVPTPVCDILLALLRGLDRSTQLPATGSA